MERILPPNFFKIPHGGYWSIDPFDDSLPNDSSLYQGQKKLYRTMEFMPLEEFLHKFKRVYTSNVKIKGTALFLIKDVKDIPFYVTQTMFFHGDHLPRRTFLFQLIKRDDPFGIIRFL